jgi:hypothetical protein
MSATERCFAWSVLLAGLLLGRTAHAADEASAHQAQQLFDRAVAALEADDFATACPALEESQRLDPAGGTVLNLAYCLEKTEQWRRAARAYREALGRAVADARADRRELAVAGLNRTLAAQPRVRLVLPEGAPHDFRLTLDGEPLALEQLDYPVPIEAGTHEVRVTLEGREPSVLTVEATAAVEYELRIPLPEPVVARQSSKSERRQPAPLPASPRPRGQTTAFWLTATGSGALLVGGGVAGILAASHHKEAVDACPAGKCSASGVADERSANRWAWGANVGIGLGLVGVAVAVYLFEKPAQRTALRSPLEVSF